MIQEYYGLNQDAFSLTPDLDFLFESGAHEEAMAHIVYGLEHNEDIILLHGDIGTGKTLALQRVVTNVSGSMVPVLLTVTILDFEQIMRLVLLKLKVEMQPGIGPAELIYTFEDALSTIRAEGRKVLLVIDEAQNLSLETLESVRLLMNLCQPGGQVLQMILAGQLGLKAKLASPRLRQLMQRIRVIYELEMMSRAELELYINHRLKVAGCDKPLFKRDAFDKIHELSRGVPRVVNRMASQALLNGYVGGAKSITASHVDDTPQFGPADGETEIGPGTEAAPAAPVEPVAPVVPAEESPSQESVAASAPTEHVELPRPHLVGSEPIASREPSSATGGSTSRPFGRLLGAMFVVVLVVVGYLTYPRWSAVLDPLQGPSDDVSSVEADVPRAMVPARTIPVPADSAGVVEPELDPVEISTNADLMPETELIPETETSPEETETNPATVSPDELPTPVETVTHAEEDVEPETGSEDLTVSTAETVAETMPEPQQPDQEVDVETAAPVPTKVVPEPVAEPEPEPEPATPELPANVLVHVGSFRQMDRAENLRARIDEHNVPVFLRTAADRRGQVWQRVYLGPFTTEAAAETAASELGDGGVINFSRILLDPTQTE